MNGQMTAAVLYGKEDVKIERVPIPRVGHGEVLIKVQVALTCGTDLKVYQRGYHARMIVPPALFGHELAGVVEEVGPGVKSFRAGMRVVAIERYFAQHETGHNAILRTTVVPTIIKITGR